MKDPKDIAREMRAEGKSYAEIGRTVGRSGHTIKLWLDEDAAEHNRSRVREADIARRVPRENLLTRVED